MCSNGLKLKLLISHGHVIALAYKNSEIPLILKIQNMITTLNVALKLKKKYGVFVSPFGVSTEMIGSRKSL